MPDLRPTPLIRTAREKDLPDVVRLDNAVFSFDPYPYFVLRQLFDAHGDHMFVLYEGEELIGYILFATSRTNSAAWGLSLAVAEGHRGRGMARRLLLKALERLREEGVEEARLAVEPANTAAIALYGSLGFTSEGEVHEAYFGPSGDRLLMSLKL
ncbi:N-acetyltransferase family protein [Streptomyces griseosporeus]